MSVVECISKEKQLQVILESIVSEVNKGCQFSQRKTELRAEHFVQTLVLGWLQKADASLNELAQTAYEMGYEVTGSAIHERMGSQAVMLLGEVLVRALRQIYAYPRLPVKAFQSFSAIHVTDSTQISIPDSLADEFAGNQGNAMLKLQVTIDYLTGQWVGMEMGSGKSPDVNSELPRHHARRGSLNLFDLGYFKQEHLRDIAHQDAYFVSRYQSQTALYDVETEAPFDLVAWLQSLSVKEAECQVKLGYRVRLPLRLVARRLSKKAADARRRKAKKKYKEQGKTCSKRYLFLLGWDLLITNLSSTDWSCVQIFDLYPIRIQIEWLFRIWKSLGQLDHFGNWRLERVLCQLYAHLIGFLLTHRLSAGWHWRDGQEYSPFKCLQIIRKHCHALLICIRHNWWGIISWQHNLDKAFRQFARKTKRKKAPSTCHTLMVWGLS